MKKLIRLASCVLVLVLSVFMLACTPTSLDKAKEKMEKAGYEVSVVAEDEGEGIVYAYKGNEKIMAIMFEDKEDAEEFYNDSVKMSLASVGLFRSCLHRGSSFWKTHGTH